MNSKQRYVVIATMFLLLVMGVFPPWKQKVQAPTGFRMERPTRLAPIFAPPRPIPVDGWEKFDESMWSIEIDFGRLCLQAVIMISGAIGLTLLMRREAPGWHSDTDEA